MTRHTHRRDSWPDWPAEPWHDEPAGVAQECRRAESRLRTAAVFLAGATFGGAAIWLAGLL